jgi:hypothetical protein
MKWFILLPGVLGVVLAQTQSAVHKEGRYWVQSSEGSIAAAAKPRLRVVAGGPLRVEGHSSPGIRYYYLARVRASDLAEARQKLGRFTLRYDAGDAWGVIVAKFPDVNAPSPELVLKVPSKLAELILDTPAGDVGVHSVTSDVTVRTGGGVVSADQIFGALSAATAGGDIRIGLVDGALQCFSGGGSIHVRRVTGDGVLETAGGEIYVRDAGGSIRASTAGNIQIDRVARAVTAVATGGLITVREAGGMVTAQTSGGAIQIDSARGVHCDSGAGTIRLRKVSGNVVAATGNGSIFADIGDEVHLDNSVLNTEDGDITVYLPSKMAVTVVARIESGAAGGGIVSEFPEIVADRSGAAFRPLTARGSLNGGGPVLKLMASRGSIYLRHQK